MENRRKNFLIPLMLLLSHLLGLLRVILVSYKFGSTTDADLLSYSFSYPNQARKKIEEGTDNLALIRKLGAERNSESVSFFILLFHFAALILLCMLSFPISNLLFRFSSFTKEAVEKGSYLILTFLCFLVLFSYGSNLNAYLQISGKKLSSTVLSSVPSFFSIVFLILFSDGIGVYSFSLGLLTGGIAYFVISFIYALKCGMRIKFTLDFDVSFTKSYLVSVFLILLSVVEILPLFLSSSFAYLSPMSSALSIGLIGKASGMNYLALIIGMILVGLIYCIFALIVKTVGTKWLNKVLPPIVIGPIIMVIGLSLAGSAISNITSANISNSPLYNWAALSCGLIALFTTALVSHYGKKMAKLIPFVIGMSSGYVFAVVLTLIGFYGCGNEYFKIVDLVHLSISFQKKILVLQAL